MLFSSYAFMLVFLPLTLAGFYLLRRFGRREHSITFLLVASLAFYAQWSLALLAILITSVIVNYGIGSLIMRFAANRRVAGALLVAGISANLLALGQLKYANFLIDIVNEFIENDYMHVSLIVPIGVSFYTFIQIETERRAYDTQPSHG